MMMFSTKSFLVVAALFVAVYAQEEPPNGNISFCGEVPENTQLQPTCPEGTVIVGIEFASYGLPTSCPEPQISETCHSETSLEVVTSACVGLPTCVIEANNVFFSDDPCQGTFKSLTMVWTCGDATQNTFCVAAEENTLMKLQCPTGTVVSNSFGFVDYGLPTACPTPIIDANCTLATEATEAVLDSCSLRTDCVFNVTNDFFGADPCLDTPKRAVIQYTCTAAPRSPQLNTALLFSTVDQLDGVAEGFAVVTDVNGTLNSAWCFNGTLRDAATLLPVGEARTCFPQGDTASQRETTFQFGNGALRILNNVTTVATSETEICAGSPTHLTGSCTSGDITNAAVPIGDEETEFNAGIYRNVEAVNSIYGKLNMTNFDDSAGGSIGFDEIYVLRTLSGSSAEEEAAEDDAAVEA